MNSAAGERREIDTVMPPLSQQFAALFTQHADFVRRSLRRLGVPASDVDDALQEVFLVVHRRIADYEDRGLLRAWLFAISRQVASHYHRGTSRAENRRRGLIIDAASPDLEELLARREAEEVVTRFLDELDEAQREVFCLSDIEGLTAPEIVVALGLNLNTVYGRLRLARKRFEKFIAAQDRGKK